MLKLTPGSMFKLVALAAVLLAVANWWPRALPPTKDGSITWYRGIWGSRSYYKITGTDRFGCTFNVDLISLPGYSQLTGAYPNGAPRERTVVYVTGSVDGCQIRREDVQSGEYFAPNGTTIGHVEDGTGNVKYCRPDGTPAREYNLDNGQIIRERMWWKDGALQSDRQYSDGRLDGVYTDYYPNGKIRSKSIVEQNAFMHADWYDQDGNPTPKPDAISIIGTY